jgi:dCTP deaminase
MIYGLLPDHEIREAIGISPFAEGVRRPGVISYGLTSYGYDARLGRVFKIFSPVHGGVIVDPKAIDPRIYHHFEGDVCIIPPNSYALAESVERFIIPRDICAVCLGKSTYARCGLICNVTPLEPEWEGKITIEISNSSPLPARVYAGEGILQIQFHRAVATCLVSYKDKQGRYDNQEGLTLPKVD